MRRLTLCVLLSLTSIAAESQTPAPSRAERVARATGLEDLLTSIQAANVAGAKAQAESILEQVRQAGVPDSVVTKLTPRVEQLVRRVTQAWDPKVAARIYAEGLGEALTDDELDDAERYYGSTEGKRAYTAITASQQKMQAYVAGRTDEVLRSEMVGFVEAVKKAAIESRKQ